MDSSGKRRSLQTRSHAEALRRAAEFLGGAAPAVRPDDAAAVRAPSAQVPDPLTEVGSDTSPVQPDGYAAPVGGADVDGEAEGGAHVDAAPSVTPGQRELSRKMAWAMSLVSMTVTALFVRKVLKREPGQVSDPTAAALASSWEPITDEWAASQSVGPWAIIGASLIAVAIEQAAGGTPLAPVAESEGGAGGAA